MYPKVISRLIQYRLCLNRFHDLGVERIFSYTLARETNVTPEQVRKDFSQFGIRGKKKAGYSVSELIESINGILYKSNIQKMILVGIGHIGKALLHYRGFQSRNMQIVAAFDIDPSKLGRHNEVPVYSMQELPDFLENKKVSIAIIAVPEKAAQQVCDLLTGNGIRGILNFAPVILKTAKSVMVRNISVCGELEALIYFTRQYQY